MGKKEVRILISTFGELAIGDCFIKVYDLEIQYPGCKPPILHRKEENNRVSYEGFGFSNPRIGFAAIKLDGKFQHRTEVGDREEVVRIECPFE